MDNPTWRLRIDNPTYLEIEYEIVYIDNPTCRLSGPESLSTTWLHISNITRKFSSSEIKTCNEFWI